jgi:hypothetical protein
MGQKRGHGYIAIARTIFDHPLLQTKKPLSRLEAWEWLINAAAWGPRGNRNKFGAIHTERGQLCITRRQLSAAWHWPKSNVDRFLKRLAAESMVLLGKALNGPKTEPKNGAIIGYPMTMVTICNYEKFQASTLYAGHKANQQPGQKAGQNLPLLPGIVDDFETQALNQQKKESRVWSSKGNRSKPPHGAKGRGMIWFDHGTSEWQAYANDYREVCGAEKLPENRVGGRGNWFRWLGERHKAKSA